MSSTGDAPQAPRPAAPRTGGKRKIAPQNRNHAAKPQTHGGMKKALSCGSCRRRAPIVCNFYCAGQEKMRSCMAVCCKMGLWKVSISEQYLSNITIT